MQLQQFVTEVIEELGGVVIPVEYALCQALIPEAYTAYFQHKSELELSFDFEVAQENPNSEFVTFGSYVLEQLLTIAHQKAKSTLRFAEIERLELGNPEKKLMNFLDEPGKIAIAEERAVLGAWAVFQYNIAYLTDEKTENSEQVWINMMTNEVSLEMKQEQNRIIYNREPLYSYPLPESIEVSAAFEKASEFARETAEQLRRNQSQANYLTKDIDRITNYYNELLAENKKRASRKGLSENKQQEIALKSDAIELEQRKQLEEIRNKYNGQIEINIDNGIFYFIPLLEFTVDIQFRSDIKKEVIYYNPITKGFFKKVPEFIEAEAR